MALIATSVMLLAWLTVYLQRYALTRKYIETEQLERHRVVLEGTAATPYQYRVLSEVLVEGAIRAAHALRLRRPELTAFLAVRMTQQILILAIALAYYRSLGLHLYERLVAISLLTWGMTYGIYNSDLSINSHTEVLCYLLAAWATLADRPIWLLPLTVVAALNRETGGLLPLLVLWPLLGALPGRLRWAEHRARVWIAGSGLAIYAVVFFGLRACLGPRPGDWHNPWGVSTVLFNLTDERTVALMLATMGILPLIAAWRLRHLPEALRGFFWILIPAWFFTHAYIARLKETRYFIMPLAVVFVPAAMMPARERVDQGAS